MSIRFPARAKSPFYLIAGAGIAALTLRSVPDRLDYNDDLSLFTVERIRSEVDGIVRSSRALYAIAFVVIDYKFSLWGLEHRSVVYQNKLKEIHQRSAQRILELCETNKGFYIKAGQFFSSLRQMPKEYSSTLSKLQDKATPCHFKDIKEVVARNLGRDFDELFDSFNEKPLAAASIAQVHHAHLRDGREVAVKVQYPGLQQRLAVDIRTMAILSCFISKMFPEYRFQWMLPEFKRALILELDFVQEGKNAERTARNFARNKRIKVPFIFWELTTQQVLTMEFFHGKKVDDMEYMKDWDIDPGKVANVLVELFSEMIFIYGFVHGDPHPGNLLVSPDPHHGFNLVVLDHGIYRELNEQFRTDYCQLWKALILMDSSKILQIGEKFGLGDYAKYFPIIFTGRTLYGKSMLGEQLPTEEKKKLRRELIALKMDDISSFMESMSPDFLTVLRTDGQLRSMMGRLGAPAWVRLKSYGRYAARGLCVWWRENGSDGMLERMVYGITAMISCLQLWIHLEILDLLWRAKGWRCLVFAKIEGLLRRMTFFSNFIS